MVGFAQGITIPVIQLTEFVGKVVQTNYANINLSSDIKHLVQNSVELRRIFKGTEDLVTALRFGNTSYAKTPQMELKNDKRALRMCLKNEYIHGVGICANNVALSMVNVSV